MPAFCLTPFVRYGPISLLSFLSSYAPVSSVTRHVHPLPGQFAAGYASIATMLSKFQQSHSDLPETRSNNVYQNYLHL